jgi:hypothetical protein
VDLECQAGESAVYFTWNHEIGPGFMFFTSWPDFDRVWPILLVFKFKTRFYTFYTIWLVKSSDFTSQNSFLITLSGISHFFGFVQYLLMSEMEIFVWTVHWRQNQEHERKNKEKGEHILSNFRQNQQCSLPQVGRLRGDNIFHFV